MFVATKILTIKEKAYDRLAALRQKDESFGEIIMEHFPKRSLLELAGILSPKETKELKGYIRDRRKMSRKRLEHVSKLLQ